MKLELDSNDVMKLDLVKKRFMFHKNIDVVRYLLTLAMEQIVMEMDQQEQKDNQGQEKSRQKVKEETHRALELAASLYS